MRSQDTSEHKQTTEQTTKNKYGRLESAWLQTNQKGGKILSKQVLFATCPIKVI